MRRAERIREMLAQEDLSAGAIEELLGVQTRSGRKRLRETLREMSKRGAVEVVKAGNEEVYRLAGRQATTDKQTKLWRALGIKAAKGEPFRYRDLALLAECSQDYAKRYLRWLQRQGWIERRSQNGGGVWFQFSRDKVWTETRPRWNRRAEARLANLIVMVERLEDDLAKAAGMIEEVQVSLMDLKSRMAGGAEHGKQGLD